MTMDVMNEFVLQSAHSIEEKTPRIVYCLQELSEDEIWKRPNTVSNSVGNIVLHLCGNVRQYIVSSLGGAEDMRERDKEFSTMGGYSRKELSERLTSTASEAVRIIRTMDEASLSRISEVQGFRLSGTGIIVHVTEHYSYHAGQIIFWTKLLKNKDLGFYADVNLNLKNKK